MSDDFYARARRNSQASKLQMTQSLRSIASRLSDIADMPEKAFMKLPDIERQEAFQAARSRYGTKHRLSLVELWNTHLGLKGCA